MESENFTTQLRQWIKEVKRSCLKEGKMGKIMASSVPKEVPGISSLEYHVGRNVYLSRR